MAVDIYDALELLAVHIAESNRTITALTNRVAALEARHKPAMKIAPVTYFYPGARWDATLAQPVAFTTINPASGPGSTIISAYSAQVAKAKAVAPVYGYVHTRYGARPLAEVKADVDKYIAWYAINGIFVDTTSNKPEFLPYYSDLSQYLRSKGLRIILNPGTKTIEGYAALCDHLMIAETDLTTYRARVAPEWEARYPREMFWHCVHTCPEADMVATVALAKSRHCGLLYVTNDVMTNPYDTLPSYWSALCAAAL